MEKQEQHHMLEREKGQWRCKVCRWTWTRRRRSACPGVPRYAYSTWPSALKTAGELKRLGRQVPSSPDGCMYQLLEPHWLWLYDEQKAIPYRKTFGLSLRVFLSGKVTCRVCEQEAVRFSDLVDGMCQTCHFQSMWHQQCQEIRRWARTMLDDKQAVFLDTETTGLGDHDVVIEVALLRASDGIPLLNTLIRPNRPISWEATYRHFLTDAHVRSAPTFQEVWTQLQPLLEQFPTVIGYSAAFHRDHLQWTAQLYGYKLPSLEWHCLMTQYAVFYGKVRPEDAQSPFQWQQISSACKQQKTIAGHSPRALNQVKRARRLLQAIAEKEGQRWDSSV